MLFDVVDVGQMVGSAIFLGRLTDLEAAFNARNVSEVVRVGDTLLGVAADVDALLCTSPHHLFGAYLLSAEATGSTPEEVSMFRSSAKRILTVWGYPMANGTAAQRSHNSGLSEYAYRLWAGLVSSYYQPRCLLCTRRRSYTRALRFQTTHAHSHAHARPRARAHRNNHTQFTRTRVCMPPLGRCNL